MWTQSLWRHETATGKPAASSFLGYIASDGCHPNSTSQALWWQRCLMGAWRDAIFEMLMQPATAPGLLDLSQCCVANDTSCFYGGMFTNERIAKPGKGCWSLLLRTPLLVSGTSYAHSTAMRQCKPSPPCNERKSPS